jgi:hypothetical protein
MAKKHVDPLKAKQKRQKVIAAVLGVLFLGVLAFTGPKTWKQLHPKAPPVATTASSTAAPPTGTPTLAAPTLQGASPNASATATGSLASAAPTLQDGQLASFSRFASKDPFAQQLSDDKSATSSTGTGSGSTGSSGSSLPSPDGIPDIAGNEPAPGTAVISVNGTLYSVTVGDDFPETSPTDPTSVPLFHLVSLTAHSAKISIVGGSYSTGARTITLKENKKVTLMNTADGTRYTLVLKPQGTDAGATDTTGTGTTTTPTVTLPPATP